ncbi:MAG: ATP-binding cassette domain-containing protein [Caulobacteraceae bacterium]|nr:ATP-binding cassette domain-containing protein [Caulobacteraceae bacterium]
MNALTLTDEARLRARAVDAPRPRARPPTRWTGVSRLDGLLRAQRRAQGGALALAAAAGALAGIGGVGLLAISGWFIAAAGMAGLAGATLGFNYLLPSAAIRAAAVLRTVGRYGERLEGHAAALRALGRIRSVLFIGVASAPASQALQLSAGEGCARLIDDVDALQTQFVRRPARWGVAAALAASLAIASLAGWRCALVLAGLAALQIFGGRFAALSLALRWGEQIQSASGRLKDACAALLAAAPEIAAYGLQEWAAGKVSDDSRALIEARRGMRRAEGWLACASTAISGAGAAVVLLLAHGVPLPVAFLAALAALGALEACAAAAREAQDEPAYRAARERLEPWIGGSLLPPDTPKAATLSLAGGGSRACLEPGDRLAITGRSGCGKTSLLERLVKLRDATPGEAEIGGVDLTRLEAVQGRANFAYAPQSPTLLAGTVRENLRLADPAASDAQMWSALADAALDARIAADPAGLDAEIGEAGSRLSGGERKRLSLARAYLRSAPWLVLDEPTEGLDQATEALVVARLDHRLRNTGQGLLLVSHRPAPRMLCRWALALD